MLFQEIFESELHEGREGFLYHWMNARKSIFVFAHDTMAARWQHSLPTDPDHTISGNSFTRDSKLKWGSYGLRLTVDQQRLSQTNKIIPLDGHYVHKHTLGRMNWEYENSRTKTGANANPSEEFVVGEIKMLHRYITAIELSSFEGQVAAAALVDVVQAYGQKWQIPVSIAPEVMAEFQTYKAYVREREGKPFKMHPDIRKWFPEYKPVRNKTR